MANGAKKKKKNQNQKKKKNQNQNQNQNQKKKKKTMLTIWGCWLVGSLTSQQHASVSQGRICSDNLTCCHTEIEVADQTFISPSHSILTPGQPVPALTL